MGKFGIQFTIMNRLSKLLLLLAWVLVVNAYGQIQQIKWYNFQPNNSNPLGVDLTSSTLATSQLPPCTLTEYRGFNSAYTNKGELIFYVVSQNSGATFYNSQGLSIHYLPFSSNYMPPLEIPIIKIGCGLLYHIIIAGSVYEYNTITGTVMLANELELNNSSLGDLDVLLGTSKNTYTNAYGVSRINESSYNIYSLSGSNASTFRLDHFVFDANNISNTSYFPIDSKYTNGAGISGSLCFDRTASVIEVSPNKQYITYATHNDIIVYNLNTDGSIGTLKGTYPFDITSDERQIIAGLEFSADNSRLYFTILDPMNPLINNSLGYIDLNATTLNATYIGGTADYSHSEIELGRDGNLYLTTPTSLVRLNTSTNVFTPTVTVNFYSNSIIPDIPESLNSRIRVLPDQIDGVDNSTGFSLKIGTYNTTRNETWSNGLNPFGVTTGESITVRNAININHEVIVTGMNFDFYTNAAINIGNGGRLVLRSCNLKGFDCGKMWNGINITGNGRLVINDNYVISSNPNVASTTPSSIADAKIAVNGIGTQFKAQIHQTNFLRNGKSIRFNNFDGLTDIIDYCTFDNTGLLKNQDATSNGKNIAYYNGWVGSVTMEFGWSNQGTSVFVSDNKITGGTFGILSNSGSFYVKKCEFKNMIEHSGIAIQASLMGAPKFADMQENKFTLVKKALRVESGSVIRFISNNIQNTEDNAVELLKGRDCKYQISKNTFNNCKNNAILLQDNAGPNSVATIDNNTILGMYVPTSSNNISLLPYVGISVFEKGKVKGLNARTFGGTFTNVSGARIDGLQITNNTMRAVTFGVKMSNVVGGQKNQTSPIDQTNIKANTIRFSSTYTPTRVLSDRNAAMELTLTDGIAITSNNIDNHDTKMNKIWNNKGVYLQGTTKILVKQNTIKAGRGIGSNDMAFDNNYTCNTLAGNHDGISLGNHSMRAAGDVHGLRTGSANIESRKNTFGTMVNSQIELWTTPLYDAFGRLKMTDIARMNSVMPNNQWIFYTGTTPKIVYYPTPTGAVKTILAGFGKDICGDSQIASVNVIPPIGELIITGDEIIDWQYQYEWVKEQKNIGNPQTGFVSELIDLQAFVSDGDYTSANGMIDYMIATNIVEEKFKIVYSIIIRSELNTNGVVDSAGIEELINIASQNPSDIGPAVHVARGILWCQLGMEFATDPERHTPIALQLKYESCMAELPVDQITAQWIDQYGTVFNPVEVGVSLLGTAFVQLTDDLQLPTDRNYAFRFIYQNRSYTSNFLSISEWLVNTNQQVDLCALGKQGELTGIDNQQKNDVIAIYPNPSSGIYTLAGIQTTGMLATVVDVNGRIVYQATMGSNDIDLSNKPDGMYYLRVTDANGKVLHQQALLKNN
jgi:hypothetical protein